MCTVSVIALPASPELRGMPGYRLIVNRDERRIRPIAEPPEWRTAPAGNRYYAPRDPKGGGTWIAYSEHGLGLVIMNVRSPDCAGAPDPDAAVSRGLLIPDLIGHDHAEQVGRNLSERSLGRFMPFRLLAIGADGVNGAPLIHEWRWNGRVLGCRTHGEQSMCWASSGRGDPLVQGRLPVFQAQVASVDGSERSAAQTRFHNLSWPGRGVESVLMSREDARTVSITTVECTLPGHGTGSAWRMHYQAIPEMPPNVPPAAVTTTREAAAVPVGSGR